jgi:hypothetical protein
MRNGNRRKVTRRIVVFSTLLIEAEAGCTGVS